MASFRTLGKATAERFAREEARLIITDVDEAGLSRLRERLAGSGAEVEVALPVPVRPGIGVAAGAAATAAVRRGHVGVADDVLAVDRHQRAARDLC